MSGAEALLGQHSSVAAKIPLTSLCLLGLARWIQTIQYRSLGHVKHLRDKLNHQFISIQSICLPTDLMQASEASCCADSYYPRQTSFHRLARCLDDSSSFSIDCRGRSSSEYKLDPLAIIGAGPSRFIIFITFPSDSGK